MRSRCGCFHHLLAGHCAGGGAIWESQQSGQQYGSFDGGQLVFLHALTVARSAISNDVKRSSIRRGSQGCRDINYPNRFHQIR